MSGANSRLAKVGEREKKRAFVKVGLIGDNAIGKTSLMVKYVEGHFQEDYIVTLGVNFLEKVIMVKKGEITFSIWDLGGQREYHHMLPIVCDEAAALLFMFDLSRKATLTSIKEWYKAARGYNKTAIPLLIGTKFDILATMKDDHKVAMTRQSRRFASAMKSPVIFCSAKNSINIKKIFKLVLSKVYAFRCPVDEISEIGQPIFEYKPETIQAQAQGKRAEPRRAAPRPQ
jgi:GTP-binding protein of the ras superfamily involved in termination of M-phase